MAIEVRIPTILRSYTDGAKSVEGSGSTLAELLADLDARHNGLRDRLVADGDTVTVLPAVAGGAAAGVTAAGGAAAGRGPAS